MTKTEAKKLVKHDLYGAISTLMYDGYDDNLREIIFRVIDNIDSKTLKTAISRGTK